MRDLVINAAIKTYRESMTRYINTHHAHDLDVAVCSARWVNSTLELMGRKPFRTDHTGLLDVPFLMDQLSDAGEPVWFLGQNVFELTVPNIREHLHQGDQIHLLHMSDDRPIEPGSIGVIDHIDDLGTLHTCWKDGRRLGVVMSHDFFEVFHAC
ncbi:DUF4314 domain-containing protein [Vibrio sp. SCSIO 43140]|uniref:DUF4314 domain-containing protein n=1 Tax=Vibrio sp. SCSIO 43140 TaxID=2819100 RepID=UPI0020752476|nr:DUF4314 domain-containing protein [Vibrio sp. SCSIO 43140]USD58868.1 DUF4314 domain-containing protein [Vibrio sp. SCSIO 43140]